MNDKSKIPQDADKANPYAPKRWQNFDDWHAEPEAVAQFTNGTEVTNVSTLDGAGGSGTWRSLWELPNPNNQDAVEHHCQTHNQLWNAQLRYLEWMLSGDPEAAADFREQFPKLTKALQDPTPVCLCPTPSQDGCTCGLLGGGE